MKKEWSPEEGWIQTYTGKKFYLTDPTPDMVCIEDIAHALSMQCRFVGHTKQFYSVAQHSVLVSALIEDSALAVYGLLHDATEAYMADMPAPLKALIRHISNGSAIDEIETQVMRAIALKFHLEEELFYHEMIKMADMMALRIEAKSPYLFDVNIYNWADKLPETERNFSNKPLKPERAKNTFLRVARDLARFWR